MKKLLFSLLISASFTAFAQSSTIVIADGILASSNFVKANSKNIRSQKTYIANATLPKNLSSFADVSKNGLLSVNLKDNYYDRISLANLNIQNNLDAQTPVLFDGIYIKDTQINILGDVILNSEVKMIDGQKVLSISSVPRS